MARKARNRGRPRGRPANHHLFLEGGVWIFRWARNGRDEQKSTGCPKSEVARARTIRDKWIGERAARCHGVEEIPPACTLAEMVKLYREAESQSYDREKGGEQPGTKRDSEGDGNAWKRLKRHLDSDLAADLLDRERLLDAADGLAKEEYAGFTIRNGIDRVNRVSVYFA